VRFKYPAIFGGREVIDVEVWFENGRVVKEKAAKNSEFLPKKWAETLRSIFLS